MPVFYDDINIDGYNLYIKDIQQYSEHVAYLLGFEISYLDSESRCELCRNIIKQYPYAYPIALELSLYLPPETAFEWLRKICDTYYAGFSNIYLEVYALLAWRFPSIRGLPFCVNYLYGKHRNHFDSIFYYIEKNSKGLYSYIQFLSKIPFSVRNIFQKILRIQYVIISKIARGKNLDGFLWNCFFKKTLFCKLFHPIFIIYITRSVNTQKDNSIFKKKWMNLKQINYNIVPSSHKYSIDFVTVCWGKKYIDKVSSLSLSSLISENNIPYLSKEANINFIFYLNKDDIKYITEAYPFKVLKKYASIHFVLIDKLLLDTYNGTYWTQKYIPLTACHNHYINTKKENVYTFFNFPDVVYENEFLKKILSLIKMNKKVIFVYPGPYISEEKFNKYRKSHNNDNKDNILSIENKELCKIFYNNLHPYVVLFDRKNEISYYGATLLIRNIASKGLVVNTTCITPTLIKFDMKFKGFSSTIDHDIPLSNRYSNNEIYICKNSNELCMVSCSENDSDNNSTRVGMLSDKEFYNDINKKMGLYNRIFFCNTLLYPISDEINWNTEIQTNNRESSDLLSMKKVPVPSIIFFGSTKFSLYQGE